MKSTFGLVNGRRRCGGVAVRQGEQLAGGGRGRRRTRRPGANILPPGRITEVSRRFSFRALSPTCALPPGGARLPCRGRGEESRHQAGAAGADQPL